MLKYILLGFLSYHPMTGYDIKTLMDYSTTHFWHAYHSQIYTTLRKLEKEGFLTSEMAEDDGKLNRRVYTITAAGRSALNDWLGHTMMEVAPLKEDFLVRVFFSGQRDREAVLAELRIQQQLHQQRLEYYETLTAARLGSGMFSDETVRDNAPFWEYTLDFGKRLEQLYLDWLDEVIADLE